MTSQEILEKYLARYKKHGHKEIPNMNLVPEGDSTLLFVNSGMFPLVPYLSGESHPLGKRLVNVQRSVRFSDIDEVGDNRHTTAFHMMGNWSLGDYFKAEQLPWIYHYFIEDLGLDSHRLYATVFEGDEYAPKDTESIEIIKKVFNQYGIDAKEGVRIFAYGRNDNWWQRADAPGELGGPSSEMFYYLGKDGNGEGKDPSQFQNEFLEIGNNVFMQYRKNDLKGWDELPQKNVDFGGGLERIALVVQKKHDIFETDNFYPIIQKLEELTGNKYLQDEDVTRAMRIIADHMRAATFLAMDGVVPSNKDQGYILRRYLRRMVRFARKLNINNNLAALLVPTIAQMLVWLYPDLAKKQEGITQLFIEEEERFHNALAKGETELRRQLQRIDTNNATALVELAFRLYQSYGYPPEFFMEEMQEQNLTANSKQFMQQYQHFVTRHQETSRKGAEQKFKGGLADHTEQVVRYHTATHLLHMALRQILGKHVEQYGSNITKDRLRFDFSHADKLNEDQIKQVESIINEAIKQKLPVNFVMLSKEEAGKSGALHFFKDKYGEQVKVYYIGNSLETAVSKEYCGGPHVKNLSELSPTLTIFKQESVGKGVRRVYARLR
ncbi:alanine--tRNA ligase [Candidatus Roizmanbacteria bacterium CG10_big_fil_rev_8_21_14_0_10_45_7]|uniref:alanine--tRNA ligase n=1 Tax=Candidatus Roizmanbacteria bacterium CG10_big_fil_rev_8_21_14_0_10_45_7 TaxID=1974854 RepID=A0A2M8KU62_9BACT|nr:MAG: alanine--tRNA ligase [Candidatus Roizmanbacteria bacterium CG10_big_fil_rev_8_21_14_0_10_45_7]